MLRKFSKTKFDRDVFCSEFKKEIPDIEDVFDYYSSRNSILELDDFIMFRLNDEFMIIHLETGTILNWYKNLGRSNMTNKKMTISDLNYFITKLSDNINNLKLEDLEEYERFKNIYKV